MEEVKNFLREMGFPEWKIEKAVAATGTSSIEQAMEWMISHEDIVEDTNIQPSSNETEQNDETSMDTSGGGEASVAKSIKCDDCGKVLRTTEEAEFHAVKTKHSNFSESTEEKQPLTEEERKKQLELLQERMKQKRIEREEKEKKEALEREKKRIQAGKEMIAIRKKLDDDEMKKLAEQRRREKEEEKRARERVRQQIEADKLARKQKAEGNVEAAPSASAPVPTVKKEVKDYSEATIQIRLTDGSTLKQSFNAKEPLSAVRLYIDMNRKDGSVPYKLMTTFPRKVFEEEDYQTPLHALGLVPSAVLVASKIV